MIVFSRQANKPVVAKESDYLRAQVYYLGLREAFGKLAMSTGTAKETVGTVLDTPPGNFKLAYARLTRSDPSRN